MASSCLMFTVRLEWNQGVLKVDKIAEFDFFHDPVFKPAVLKQRLYKYGLIHRLWKRANNVISQFILSELKW